MVAGELTALTVVPYNSELLLISGSMCIGMSKKLWQERKEKQLKNTLPLPSVHLLMSPVCLINQPRQQYVCQALLYYHFLVDCRAKQHDNLNYMLFF